MLHRRDGFFRLAPPGTTWGTSAVLPPALWTGGRYVQGAPVVVSWRLAGASLLLALGGAPGGSPSSPPSASAPPEPALGAARGAACCGPRVRVYLGAAGPRLPLDPRPGEGAKLVTLSSMRVSRRRWDAQEALAGGRCLSLPSGARARRREGGLAGLAPRAASAFALLGGAAPGR